MSQTQLSTINFHSQSLITFEQNGTHYTAMKPICENIGLNWASQYSRIKRDEVLSQGIVIITTPSNGGDQQMMCLPIEYLNGWLFGIDVKRVKPEIREKLITYKKECYQALFDYWNKQEPKQLALPAPEQTYTLNWTESELKRFVSFWCAAFEMHDMLKRLEPALQSLGSKYHPTVFSQVREYQSTLDLMHYRLQRDIDHLQYSDPHDRHWQYCLETINNHKPIKLRTALR